MSVADVFFGFKEDRKSSIEQGLFRLRQPHKRFMEHYYINYMGTEVADSYGNLVTLDASLYECSVCVISCSYRITGLRAILLV